jgi:hypothetical protein
MLTSSEIKVTRVIYAQQKACHQLQISSHYSGPRRPWPLCYVPDLGLIRVGTSHTAVLPLSHREGISLILICSMIYAPITLSASQGCTRIREGGRVQTRPTPVRRSQRPRSVLCHAMCGLVQEGRPEDCVLRCATSRGIRVKFSR